MYQPQVASWDNQRHMVAFSAVSHRATGADKPALGTVKLEADTEVALTERLVSFAKMKIVEANFPTLNKDQIGEVAAVVEKMIPTDDRVIALDRVLANVDKSGIIPKNVEGIKADPPTIFFSKTPAVIVNLDGEPIWSPIKDNDLKFAVNTNWDLFQHVPSNTYYLRNNANWFKAPDAVKGPWAPAGTLPDSFKKLPPDENWNDVRANLPGKPVAASAMPKVFTSQQPAELILVTGEPKYAPVQGTGLQWVSNTESDVFRLGTTGAVYYLVAGRWFSAPDFAGPWTFATPTLPADFKKIPMEHPRSRVLASVPGTDAAAEAVLLAQIPQTARVNKKEVKAPDVAFQGNPEFAPIESTTVQRAVNTDKDVFKVGDLFYMCHQGVWFAGKTATGPWEVASTVPEQIYKIPVSSPAHHVTYVTIEEDRRRVGHLRRRRRLHRHDGRVGMHGLGLRLVLPALLGIRGVLSLLLRALPDLRVFRLVQPVDRRVRTQRGGVRALRRRRRRRPLQPAHRNLRARRGGLWPVRRARRGAGVQPAHRYLRLDPAGIERLRQLGLDRRAARRRLGEDESLHQPADRHHDAHDQDGRGQRGDAARERRRPRRGRRRRQRLRRQGRQRLSATRTARGRSTTTVDGRTPTSNRRASGRRRGSPPRRTAPPPIAPPIGAPSIS